MRRSRATQSPAPARHTEAHPRHDPSERHMPWTDLTASQPIRAWLFNPTQPRRLLIAGWSNAAWSTAAVVALAVTHDPILVAWWVLGSEPLLVAVIYRWTEKSNRAATGEQDEPPSGGPPDPSPGRPTLRHLLVRPLGSNPDVGRTHPSTPRRSRS